MEVFTGTIMAVGFDFAPRGWSLCNGQLMSISQNSALFSLLGATFGGDGQTTFAVPDLRGRVPRGTGQGPGLNAVQLGEVSGTETVTILSSQMPPHVHGGAFTSTTTGTGSVTITAPFTGSADVTGTFQATTGAATSDVPQVGYTLGDVNGTSTRIYASSSTGTAVAIGAVNAAGTISGDLTAPATITLPTITGTVAVGAAGNGQPTSILSPYLGLTMVIALEGIYPSRP
jgi:microcystin-dependent protein